MATQLHGEVPQDLQNAIRAIPWKNVGHASYRKCKSIHLGLGTARNVRKRVYFGAASKIMPELQKLLTDYIRETAPQINFASIIVNRYSVKESMDFHTDRNWEKQPVQLVGRFGEGCGGELEICGKLLKTGVFLVDGNVPHRVHECEAGTLYSFVTYIKQHTLNLIVPALPQLKAWGFQLSLVSEMYVSLAIVLLALLQLQGAFAAHGSLQLQTAEGTASATVQRTSFSGVHPAIAWTS